MLEGVRKTFGSMLDGAAKATRNYFRPKAHEKDELIVVRDTARSIAALGTQPGWKAFKGVLGERRDALIEAVKVCNTDDLIVYRTRLDEVDRILAWEAEVQREGEEAKKLLGEETEDE